MKPEPGGGDRPLISSSSSDKAVGGCSFAGLTGRGRGCAEFRRRGLLCRVSGVVALLVRAGLPGGTAQGQRRCCAKSTRAADRSGHSAGVGPDMVKTRHVRGPRARWHSPAPAQNHHVTDSGKAGAPGLTQDPGDRPVRASARWRNYLVVASICRRPHRTTAQ